VLDRFRSKKGGGVFSYILNRTIASDKNLVEFKRNFTGYFKIDLSMVGFRC
jgi:hypothetical protein